MKIETTLKDGEKKSINTSNPNIGVEKSSDSPPPVSEEPAKPLLNETLAEEFLKTVDSKIKKSEKDTWLVPNHDHLYK